MKKKTQFSERVTVYIKQTRLISIIFTNIYNIDH